MKSTRSKVSPIFIAALLVVLSSQSQALPACTTTISLKVDKQTSAPDLRRSNVPTCDGRFVSGVQVVGNGIKWYPDAMHAGECFNVDVEFLPTGVRAHDLEAVADFLEIEVDIYRRVESNSICAR